MAKTILEKSERIRNGEITMKIASYQANIGRAYRFGKVKALLQVGKTCSEIAEITGIKEAVVKSMIGE